MANKDTGPDNNKRLAALESGVSTLAIALDQNGFKLASGADPIEEAIKAIKGQAEKIDDLATSGEAAIAAVARADELNEQLLAANKEIEALNNDIEQLEGRLEALQSAGNEDALAPVPVRERPEHARDFGPTFGLGDRKDIAKLIAEGAAFEIAFSNGDHELVELAPVPIEGKDLVGVEGRYMAPKIFVRGGEILEHLHGAALVHGGEQLAYCEFPSPIPLEPKQQRGFEKAITFG